MSVPGMHPSLDAIFRAEVETVFGFLLLRCGSRATAEDLTGETFLDASRRFAADRGDEVTPAWLVTVARRRLIDHWRSSGSQRRRVALLAAERRQLAPDRGHDQIEEALASLPTRQRSALVLRYLDDYSVSEIADMFDTSYKAAESLLSRARASFHVAYQEVTCG